MMQEASPSAGWRAVYRAMGVSTSAESRPGGTSFTDPGEAQAEGQEPNAGGARGSENEGREAPVGTSCYSLPAHESTDSHRFGSNEHEPSGVSQTTEAKLRSEPR